MMDNSMMVTNLCKLLMLITLCCVQSSNGHFKPNRMSQQQQDSTQLSCPLNTMCHCHTLPNDTSIYEISCNQVPLYKFPEFLHGTIKHIEISHSFLPNVDDETFQGLRLETIKLSDNQIYEISEKSFSSMIHTLLLIDLTGNYLQELPLNSLKYVNNLSRLIAQRNFINNLEGNWGNLADSLRSLLLSGNSISHLDFNNEHFLNATPSHQHKTFTRLKRLVWLDLSDNRIIKINPHYLPESLITVDLSRNNIKTITHKLFDHLKNLKIISFRDNLISELNDFENTGHGKMHSLEKIDLAINHIERIPSNLFNGLIKVKALNFEKNYIRTIPEYAFNGLGIVHLVLSFNRLRDIDENGFYGLENSLEYLDLERNSLRNIPEAISTLTRLKYLYFTSNRISSVEYQFPVTLKVLSLGGNHLTEIPMMALGNCTELTYLNIGYNKISQIKEDDFYGWGSQIQTLLLRNNKISSLNYGAFNGLDSIKEISLSFNDIHYVHPNVFENISKTLKILELSFGIYCDEFPIDAFGVLTEIVWLGLDNNNLKYLTESAFASMAQLTFINLSFNRIVFLPKGTFIPEIHRNLVEVDVGYNLIEKIASNTFDDLTALQIVHLTSNRLKTIEKYAFFNLPYVYFIDLSHNHIFNVSDNSMAFLPNLFNLDMSFNQLSSFRLKFFKHVSNSSTPLNLNISNNRLTKFDGELNSYLYVVKLDLSNNHLVETELFESLAFSLKFLYLNRNNFSALSTHAFGFLNNLEVLELSHNHITSLRRRTFQGLNSLQQLHLDHNGIEQLQIEQFSTLHKLRILRLNGNRLKTLPRDIFLNTRIEYLDLSDNQLSVWPSMTFSEIGFTLRKIDFGYNQIEQLDATMFINVQFLLGLNLTANKITTVDDDTFLNLGNLTELDLSRNSIVGTNYRELLKFTPKLKVLNLRSTGLSSITPVALLYLADLDVSQNYLNEIPQLERFHSLRILKMSYNKLTNLTNLGRSMPDSLRILDISHNPIRRITSRDFDHLHKLETLAFEEIKSNIDGLVQLQNLKSILLTNQPNVGEILAKIQGVRYASVTINDDHMGENLFSALGNNTKLKVLEIRAPKLKKLSRNSFYGLSKNNNLMLRVHGTLVDDLPPGLFYSLKEVPKLSIDLSSNLLTVVSPDSFYPNASAWDAVGTRSVMGGIDLANNPLQCDCSLVWLGHWLRRWLREAAQANQITKTEIRTMMNKARQTTCHDTTIGKLYTLLEVFPEDLLCHASALASVGNKLLSNVICNIFCSLIIFLNIFNFLFWKEKLIDLSNR